jgi:error-prone DNA polymerase
VAGGKSRSSCGSTAARHGRERTGCDAACRDDDQRASECGLRRHRPGTAKGFVFLSLEDETGIANIILTPDLFERERLTVTRHRFLRIDGLLQNHDRVEHVRAKTLAPFQMAEVAISSHDFH